MTEKDLEIQELRRKLAECEYAEDIIRDMNAGVRKKCGAEYWGLKPWQMDHAVELFHEEEHGRLVVLPPCNIGDLLYEIDLAEYGVITCKVLTISYYVGPMFHVPGNPVISELVVTVEVVDGHGLHSSYDFVEKDFGETVFLTYEEAEAALNHWEAEAHALETDF